MGEGDPERGSCDWCTGKHAMGVLHYSKRRIRKKPTLNQRRNHVDHPKGLQVTFLKSDEFGVDPDSPVAR